MGWAELARQGKTGCVSGPGPQAGGLAGWPAIIFLICLFCGPKSDFNFFHFKFS